MRLIAIVPCIEEIAVIAVKVASFGYLQRDREGVEVAEVDFYSVRRDQRFRCVRGLVHSFQNRG